LRTLPRLKGRSSRVVITEYDLPQPQMEPHDVVVDSKGRAWWADFMRPTLGMLDPQTGRTTLYEIPVTKPQLIVGNNDLEIDYREHLWTANMQQGSITDFDPQTHRFETYTIDPNKYESVPMVAPPTRDDPHAWTNGEQLHGLHRLDTVTGKWEAVPLYEADGSALTAYGVYRDSDGNGYTLDFNDAGRSIAKVDRRTMQAQLFETPTAASRPRRGRPDWEGKLWFAEYGGNAIASFDFASQAFQEWPIPDPHFWPYDVVRARNGEVWTGSMWNDHVARLDPKSGRFTLYPLPSSTNIRRVFVDNRTTPATFWVGNNLHASIVKVEPLD
jgi:virginiamycin B lyase